MPVIRKLDKYVGEKQLKQIKKWMFRFVVLLSIATLWRIFTVDDSSRRQRLIFYMIQYMSMILVLFAATIVRKKFDFHIPIILETSFVIFAFCGFILGDVFDFYGKIPIWDDILHTLSGILLAIVGLVIIGMFVNSQKIPISLSPLFVSIAVVLFSLSLGALWEIGEYIYDDLLGTNTQQFMETTDGSITGEDDIPLQGHAALEDTMTDLMLDFVGSVVVATTYYVYEKRKGVHLVIDNIDEIK